LPNTNTFHPSLEAVRLPNGVFPGCALRIGDFDRRYYTQQPSDPTQPSLLRSHVDPVTLLYSNKLGQVSLPLAVYRFQVPSPEFPNVSHDLVQVTPLMESIAYEHANDPVEGVATRLHDPYVRVVFGGPFGGPREGGALYLLDTQPVIVGVRYRYLVVRFTPNREILEVIPTNDVEVTP
jgi:hypothetical protein